MENPQSETPQYVSFRKMFVRGRPEPPEEPLLSEFEFRLLQLAGVVALVSLFTGFVGALGVYWMWADVVLFLSSVGIESQSPH
jgi:hypothetical protein